MSTAGGPEQPAETTSRFGGFTLAGLQLALPMLALREVLPLQRLQPLPTPADGVIGGVDLRGVLVPVLDLRRVMGLAVSPQDQPAVVVMVHGGHILGLLADGISGVFEVAGQPCCDVSVQDPVAAVLAGTVRRDDTGCLVSILSPAAIAAWPQVPMVRDPEPQRAAPRAGDALAATGLAGADAQPPWMLMRCGPMPLAIEALAVQATLAQVQVLPSPLAQGACRGVIAYDGQHIGALDLLALCGLGRLQDEDIRQAFVLQLPKGRVAMLVSEVTDIVRCPPSAMQPLPRFALPRPELLCGALQSGVVPGGRPCLALDRDAIGACAEVSGLAATNTPADKLDMPGNASAAAGGGTASGGAGRSMLTFDLGREVATPIDQVQEILAFGDHVQTLDGNGPVIGLLCNRDRTIPVVCLSRLLLKQALPDRPQLAGVEPAVQFS